MDDWTSLTGPAPDFPDDPGLETFMWHVFKTGQGCDVHFQMRNRPEVTFAAHKLILSIWSPRFADMFNGAEKQTGLERVTLEDVEPEVVESMFGFMYGVDPPFESVRRTAELFTLAEEYEVCALADLCRKRLADVEIDITNVFEVMESAKSTGDIHQRERCLSIVQGKTRGILALYDCEDFTPAMVHTILDCPKLQIKCEYELFNWLFAWARIRFNSCSEYRTVREVLAEFLPKLNFMDLTDSQFATLFSQQEGVFEDKEALSIFMNIGMPGSMDLPDWCRPNDREYIA